MPSAEKNIRNRLPSASLALKESIGRLHERYADIKKGDICELSYSGSRTSFYHNGILRAEIDGADFASAYFGIWLSENPISLKLRNDLLGKHK